MPRKPQAHRPGTGARTPRHEPPRPTSAQRGYGADWQRARAAFLAQHPFCVQCQEEGKVVLATVVDHQVPHKGDGGLFWDEGNWQPLCETHHNRKTARQDGGFGRNPQG